MKEGTASRTARSVAARRLTYARVQAPYGDPSADVALARDVAAGLSPPEDRMQSYLRVRTAFFDRVVVNAIDRGFSQIVVGGAGYDGRALRYAKPGTAWFEVDHPATQEDKRDRLARLGIDASHVRFVPADFTADPVADLLRSAGLDARRLALFLLEGVAVYLERGDVERVAGQFRSVARAGARLAISVSTAASEQARECFRESVAAAGEPARSVLPADEARGLLARAGWQVTDIGGPRGERLGAAGLLSARAVARHPERTMPSPSRHAAAAAERAPAAAAGGLPLPALLSHALVAYTIEFDNEFEHRMPHRTSQRGLVRGAPRDAPWLTSLVMWANCVRHIPDDGITVAGLRRAARTGTNTDGMRRWGYLTLTWPDGYVATRAGRASGYPRITPETLLRLTERGREAGQVWAGLDEVVAGRWRERLGAEAVATLRAALGAVAGRLDPALPECLPILGYGLFSRTDAGSGAEGGAAGAGPDLAGAAPDLAGRPLWALLSPVLLAFAVEYEAASELSLAISANVLRVLAGSGVRSRDIPALAGVSKESVAMAMGILRKASLATDEPDPAGGRAKVTRLTQAGVAARDRYAGLAGETEARWRERFGPDAVDALRNALEGVSGRLSEGLRPYPDGWRAMVRPSSVLPHYPMVLHRGGYPDGS